VVANRHVYIERLARARSTYSRVQALGSDANGSLQELISLVPGGQLALVDKLRFLPTDRAGDDGLSVGAAEEAEQSGHRRPAGARSEAGDAPAAAEVADEATGPTAEGAQADGSGPAPRASSQAGSKRRRRTLLRALFEVAVLALASVFVVLRLGNSLGSFAQSFRHLHWHWLLLGVAAEGGSVFCLSWLQQRLLREGRADVGVRDLLPVTVAANGVAQSLPAGSLFAEGYSFRQYQRLGAGWTLAGWAELSAGALEAFALATVALAGAIVVGGPLRLQLLPGLAFVFVGAGVAAALFRRTAFLGRLIGRVLTWSERFLPSKWCTKIDNAEHSVREMACFRPSVRTWLRAWAVATCNWGLDCVVLVAGLLTAGVPVPWRAVLLCYATAQLLVELPITPGGLGIVEGGLTELLTRFHVGVTQATAGTLMYRAVSYWLLLIVGWAAAAWLSFHTRRQGRRPAPDPCADVTVA
jgi:uncharacterized membrane protein YbhN (UPF0104 family)